MEKRIDNDYFFRPVKQEDLRRIWEIRNHPAVRRKSNNSVKISWDDHKVWFRKKYFSGEKNYCFILADVKNSAIGYCRLDYDRESESYIISIALDLAYAGRGLGHKLLSKTLEKFVHEEDVLAEIKKKNIRSIRLFQKNDFKIYKDDKKNYYLKFKKTKKA